MLTFVLMLVLSGFALAVATFAHNSLTIGKSQWQDKQAWYVAEAGWQRARQQIVAGTWTSSTCAASTCTSDGSTCQEVFPSSGAQAGEYLVTITASGSNYTITSSGYVPDCTSPAPVARRQVVETDATLSSSDGTNLSLTATASASSSNGSNTPEKANDGSTTTYWEAGTEGNGSWLAMDHGSATTLDKIVVKEKNFIDDLTIEYSDDASSWTVVSGLSVSASGKTWTATFTETSHRYFRARLTDVPSNKKASVEEMEDYNTGTSLGTGAFTTQW